jgi:AcrR family transcriptional regulator
MNEPTLQEATGARTNAELREDAMTRMVQTSIDMIAERGASRLSLVDVGREAGYSHSLPNYYFKTKTRLLTDVYAYILQRARVRIRTWVKTKEPGRVRPGLQNVQATIRAYLGLIQSDPAGSRAMHIILSESVSSMPELLHSVRPHNRQLLEFFEAELRTAVQRGEVDASIDVPSLALLIAALLRGSVAQYMVDPEKVDLDRLATTLTQLLSRGVSAPVTVRR